MDRITRDGEIGWIVVLPAEYSFFLWMFFLGGFFLWLAPDYEPDAQARLHWPLAVVSTTFIDIKKTLCLTSDGYDQRFLRMLRMSFIILSTVRKRLNGQVKIAIGDEHAESPATVAKIRR
jgi:hypothetical protein